MTKHKEAPIETGLTRILTNHHLPTSIHFPSTDTGNIESCVRKIEALIHKEVLKARIEELNRIPNFELPQETGNAVDHIIKRTKALKALQTKEIK